MTGSVPADTAPTPTPTRRPPTNPATTAAGDSPAFAQRDARPLLAFCDMATLYLRNVPPELSERLTRLAARAGMSVSAFAVRELAELARRADNPALLADLPDLGLAAEDVLAELEAGRSDR